MNTSSRALWNSSPPNFLCLSILIYWNCFLTFDTHFHSVCSTVFSLCFTRPLGCSLQCVERTCSISPDAYKAFRNCSAFYFGVTSLVVVPFDFYVFSGGCFDTLELSGRGVRALMKWHTSHPLGAFSPDKNVPLSPPPQNLSQRAVNSKGINRCHFYWLIPWFYLQLCDRRKLWGSIHCASPMLIDKYFIILNKHVFHVKFL